MSVFNPASTLPARATEVLDFWFKDHGTKDWFAKNPDFDAKIRDRFAALLVEAGNGKLDSWGGTARGALALIVVLDQFSRNLNRDGALAFANDARALRLARQAIAKGFHKELALRERSFIYLPFEHSESKSDQELSVRYFIELGDSTFLEAAKKHKAIVDRFGRFPHRNAALGRTSTPEEIAFLAGPGSSF